MAKSFGALKLFEMARALAVARRRICNGRRKYLGLELGWKNAGGNPAEIASVENGAAAIQLKQRQQQTLADTVTVGD